MVIKKMLTLNEAIAFACKKHEGQLDKSDKWYILHPLAVMFKLLEQGISDEDILITAVLHDVFEDTDATVEEIEAIGALEDKVKEALGLLTHQYPKKVEGFDMLNLTIQSEGYEDYIRRLSNNIIATKVKIADLRHNLDMDRVIALSWREFKVDRIGKYIKALKMLTAIDAQRSDQ